MSAADSELLMPACPTRPWARRAAVVVSLVAALCGRAATGAEPGGIVEARAVLDGQVLPGVRLYAYASVDDLVHHRPHAVSGPSIDNGSMSLAIPPGSWYLVAKKLAAGPGDGPLAVGDLFGYQGSNPVSVAPGKPAHAGFALFRKDREVTYEGSGADPKVGSIAGTLVYLGEPLDGARVSLYTGGGSDFRGQVHAASPPTGKSGSFRFDQLAPGRYFLIARKRASGAAAGPMGDGDYFGYLPDNPVEVREGMLARVSFPLASKAAEIGREDDLFHKSATRIEGSIVDAAGRPVAGAYAFAYREKAMAGNRPAFISRQTGPDGRFTLHLGGGGTWYVGARTGYGEAPAVGEFYGKYRGTTDHSVTVGEGKTVEGIDLAVAPVSP